MRIDYASILGTRRFQLTISEFFRKENGKLYCIATCDCGVIKEMLWDSINRGQNKSCGCYKTKLLTKHSTTHGKTKTREYNCWVGMRNRCYTPKNADYARYGERGIEVCSEWKDSFETFYNDMGDSPSPLHSINRIDNDGNYSKSNCEWATNAEQSRNRISNVQIKIGKKTYLLSDVRKRYGIASASFYRTKQEKGLTHQQAFDYIRLKRNFESLKAREELVQSEYAQEQLPRLLVPR
jgi:hypothetical protein